MTQGLFTSSLLSICLAVSTFWACSPFPENPSKPFLTGSFDTVVARKNLIGPEDSLLWWYSIANQSGQGSLEWRVRFSPSADYRYDGPDPAIPALRTFPLGVNVANQQVAGWRIPALFVPGEFIHLLTFRNSEGQTSDTLKKKIFQYHPAYPELVLDTPLNGMLGSHILTTQKFKVQFRCFGENVNGLRFEWFDSTKTLSLAPAIEVPITSDAERRFNNQLEFPARKGQRFFLKSTLKNAANRSITWWVPMTRKLN